MNLRIGHIKDSFECTATESEAELMTHQTLRSVAAYDIFGSDSLCFVVGRFDLSHDAIRVLRKTLKFGFPQNITLMLLEISVKKMCSVLLCSNINTNGKGLRPFPMSENSSSPRISPSINSGPGRQLSPSQLPLALDQSDRKSPAYVRARQSLLNRE